MTQNIIDAVNASRPKTFPTVEEEATLVRAAQAGDRDAFAQILRNYVGLIVNEIDRALRLNRHLIADPVDARSEAFNDAVVVLHRVVEHWTHDRIGGMLRTSLRNDQNFSAFINKARPITVPFQTLIARQRALKAAGNDIAQARVIGAEKHSLRPETFDAIGNVFGMYSGDGTEADVPGSDATMVRVETLQDAARALDVLQPNDRALVEAYFGLNGSPEQSQTQIAAALGVSRQTVNKRLARATLKMQAAMNPEETP